MSHQYHEKSMDDHHHDYKHHETESVEVVEHI